ncbi:MULTISPECIES: hypothetical protein [unclassified Bradyrhizobium]|uniref:hypothetical protein n=1 Tax=unclassified Bradyrhizobium TaxID=2631580 RepID=UPI00143D16FF|nr:MULTISPECIES: hypothetical protein [unclassified Bradyrhizobium]
MSLQAVPLGTESVNLIQHALQQGVGGLSRYTGSLELKDLLSVPSDLDAHVFDLSPDVIEVRHPFRPKITIGEHKNKSGTKSLVRRWDEK